MKIEAVELRRIKLELVAPFQTSFGTETDRDILLVRVMGPTPKDGASASLYPNRSIRPNMWTPPWG